MEKNYLLLTLGHGSSAIFVNAETREIIGYEQERISGIKSDSQFPTDAINEILKHVSTEDIRDCKIRISHWFNSTDDSRKVFMASKYMTTHDYIYLQTMISNDIEFTCRSFTHHDAHAMSAYSFFNFYAKDKCEKQPAYIICADGFGTNEEVLSVYKARRDKNCIKLCARVKGYNNSLGLMYQYATSFCGMKENQDEYKFLGYEAHIDEVLDDNQIDVLDNFVDSFVNILYKAYEEASDIDMEDEETRNKMLDAPKTWLVQSSNAVIDFSALGQTKSKWHERFREIIDCFNQRKDVSVELQYESYNARCIIAYVIQQTIEIYMKRLVQDLGAKNVIVVGGCFYNVKLNNAILKSIDGLFCAMPLAGDQGAAIGMLVGEEGASSFDFKTLAIGKRRLYNIESVIGNRKNIHVIEGGVHKDVEKYIARCIADGNIVNIVYGPMEFGPRALCNTSTICLPTVENVAANNTMNNRNEVMPCAPICTQDNADYLFSSMELQRTIGSDHFMICTHEYSSNVGYSKTLGGVMHNKTLEYGIYTGRPQIVRNGTFMYNILKHVERMTGARCLVNTSFNAHGRPIVFETMDIIHNFNYQCEHAPKGKEPILFVIK